jgi:hypothetical protein
MKNTDRQTAPPLRLLANALGPPQVWPGKVRRFGELLLSYTHGDEVGRRLQRLRALGVVESIPTATQLVVGAIDMLRFWISPAAADYYRSQGISYSFHQVLRLLDEPASLGDPIGLLSTADGIIGHLMQVVHANPLYDIQLLTMFPDGLDELEAQLVAMCAGHHPRQRSIGAIVEEADYHQRLLAWLRAYRRDAGTPPPLRSNISAQAHYQKLEAVFGAMTTSFRYFSLLPTTKLAALSHLLSVREFPWALWEGGQVGRA